MKLKEKVAIVTGGGRGIGKNIALAYGREGAGVVVAARTLPEIESTAEEIKKAGGDAVAVRTDVTIREEVDRLVSEALDRYARIDIVVNNAGIQGPIGPVASNDLREWIETVAVNLVGTFHCCSAVLPSMIERKRGKIINISGGGSVSPRPYFTAYGVSKAAVVRFTESLAAEVLPFNIQVNTMAPGATPTKMLEEIVRSPAAAGEKEVVQARGVLAGKGVDIERQAACAVFLASDDSDGLTGRMIHTNDEWEAFTGRIPEIMATDLYTVRRIQP